MGGVSGGDPLSPRIGPPGGFPPRGGGPAGGGGFFSPRSERGVGPRGPPAPLEGGGPPGENRGREGDRRI